MKDRVCMVKWYWGNSEHIYKHIDSISHTVKTNYIALPTCNNPHSIWDRSISYCYAVMLDQNIKIPYFEDKDKIGWFINK